MSLIDCIILLGEAQTIFSAAAAHHRLLWIHPFLDGNGRAQLDQPHRTHKKSWGSAHQLCPQFFVHMAPLHLCHRHWALRKRSFWAVVDGQLAQAITSF
ncbi:Fic family protein [Seongchinamella sediminis]|uniref:Fic family protein n=1 Tax=Seongchinamella sediminis TaxID=2283635 RepID=UPI0019678491